MQEYKHVIKSLILNCDAVNKRHKNHDRCYYIAGLTCGIAVGTFHRKASWDFLACLQSNLLEEYLGNNPLMEIGISTEA
jgi:hypothetical protein